MAAIKLKNVSIEIPILGYKDLRHTLISSLKSNKNQANNSVQNLYEKNGNKFIKALTNISFNIKDGMRLGVIGHNGAGKTSLLKLLAGIYTKSRGELLIQGRVVPLFSSDLGIEPEESGYENIRRMAAFFGFDSNYTKELTKEVEGFSDLGHYLELPVRVYSTGMKLRLTFSIFTSVLPEILLIDEGIGTGDARFQKKVKNKVDNMIKNTSILVISSHDTNIIRDMCTHCLVLDQGQNLNFSLVEEGLKYYKERNDKLFISKRKKINFIGFAKQFKEIKKSPPKHLIPTKNLIKSWNGILNEQFFLKVKEKKYEFRDQENYPITWNELLFLFKHPQILNLIEQNKYDSGWDFFKKNYSIIGNHFMFFNMKDMRIPNLWDEVNYLKENDTVVYQLINENYKSGWHHFSKKKKSFTGSFFFPKNAPNSWNENLFLTENINLVSQQKIKCGWDFFLKSGIRGKYAKYFIKPDLAPVGWNEYQYIKLNKNMKGFDFSNGVTNCWDHFKKIGIFNRAEFFFSQDSNLPSDIEINKFLKNNRHILHCLAIGLFDSVSSYLKSYDT